VVCLGSAHSFSNYIFHSLTAATSCLWCIESAEFSVNLKKYNICLLVFDLHDLMLFSKSYLCESRLLFHHDPDSK
jgi:hypothetical protein